MNCSLAGSSNIKKQMSDLFVSHKKKNHTLKSQSNTNGVGAEELAQQLRVPVVLAEDLGFVPSIHMVAHNHLKLQFQVPRNPVT